MKGLKQFGTLKPKCHRMDGWDWIGYLQTGPFLDHLAVIINTKTSQDCETALASGSGSGQTVWSGWSGGSGWSNGGHGGQVVMVVRWSGAVSGEKI